MVRTLDMRSTLLTHFKCKYIIVDYRYWYRFLFEHLLSIILDIYLGTEWLNHMVILCLIFLRTHQTFPQWLHHFYISTSKAGDGGRGSIFPCLSNAYYFPFFWIAVILMSMKYHLIVLPLFLFFILNIVGSIIDVSLFLGRNF